MCVRKNNLRLPAAEIIPQRNNYKNHRLLDI